MTFTVLGAVLLALAAPQYERSEAPGWVHPVAVPAPKPDQGGKSVLLLRDKQVRVDATREEYQHYAWKVFNSAGVEEVAHHSFEWDPAYESLNVHGIWRVRDGKRESVWNDEDARVLQREQDLEERLYDGRLSLVVEMRDVRPQDVIEVAWTVRGENPVLDGHYSTGFTQRTWRPVQLDVFRLLWGRKRPLRFRTHGGAIDPEQTQAGRLTEYHWRQEDLPAVPFEDSVPEDVSTYPVVEFSDWRDWNEVAVWADQLFGVSSPSPKLDKVAGQLRTQAEAQRAQLAARFAQDDVRYTGIELGAHSHQPHAPDWVVERGFGDCKDKALLLVTLLRKLGRDARPALVNTTFGSSLDRYLPSPLQFDHAIVRVAGAPPLYVDATRTHMRGPIDQWPQPRFGLALVVDPATTALEPISQPPEPPLSFRVTQEWTVADFKGAAKVLVESEAMGTDAIGLRRRLNSSSRDTLVREYQKSREDALQLSLTPVAFEWKDGDTRVVLSERYEVAHFFSDAWKHDFQVLYVDGDLPSAPHGSRTHPFSLYDPLHIEERIIWNAPRDLPASAFDLTPVTIDNQVFRYVSKQQVSGRRLEVTRSLVTRVDRVLPSALAAYRDDVRRVRDVVNYSVTLPPQEAEAPDDDPTSGVVLLVVLAILGGVAVAARVRSSRARAGPSRFRDLQRQTPGDGPENPAVVASTAATRALFSSRTCSRGHTWADDVEQKPPVLFGDERINVFERRCGTCDEAEHRYVKLKFLN